jgi:predicted RNA polymerase sigma factor
LSAGRGVGAYGLQASIAECHAVARTAEETDWDRIVILYEALGRLAPSPIIELNRAVAVAMASGPAAGLELVRGLEKGGALKGSHVLPAVRGELLAHLGRSVEARESFLEALRMCSNAAERFALERKVGNLEAANPG